MHSQTTLILAAFVFLALPIMVGSMLKPWADRSVAWWCAGSLMAGAGLVLMGLRSWLPMTLSYHVANTCLLGCFVLWSQSLRIQLGRPWRLRAVALWLLLCAGFFTVLMSSVSSSARGFGVRLALGGLALLTAHEDWQLSRRVRSGNAAVIAFNYAVLGLMLAGQALLTAQSISVPNPFSNTWDASLLALTAVLTAMIAHFCYVGMMLDLAANERIEAQLAQEGARQTQWLDVALRGAERRSHTTMLSGSLAHELNQPLTVAMMNAELAQRHWQANPSPTPPFLQLLTQLDAGIDRTVQILQRIRSGSASEGYDLLLAPLDLQAVLDQSLDQVRPEIQRLGVTLHQERSPVAVPCRGDEVALSQVMVNLLRNAVQAMADQPVRELTLTCQIDHGHAQVVVRDSGPGLGIGMKLPLGEPLQSTKSDGLGMGLAISWNIVQRHQGQLSLRNHPDGGAQALVRLPLAQEAP